MTRYDLKALQICDQFYHAANLTFIRTLVYTP